MMRLWPRRTQSKAPLQSDPTTREFSTARIMRQIDPATQKKQRPWDMLFPSTPGKRVAGRLPMKVCVFSPRLLVARRLAESSSMSWAPQKMESFNDSLSR